MGDNRATEDLLASLHGSMAKYFKKQLESGEPLSPSELNCIRQFLKDNGIDCVGGDNKDIHDITAGLPTFENDSEDMSTNLLN